MTLSRLHRQPGEPQSFGRAKLSLPTLFLLGALRTYAIFGVGIAVYSFFRALQ
jgi:hypothetical protein